MQYLFALLVLVAVVVCAMAQWPYYAAAPYYNTHHGLGYPYAYNYGTYNPAPYNAGYNPALYNAGYPYLWKK